jgi:hypothetical protein
MADNGGVAFQNEAPSDFFWRSLLFQDFLLHTDTVPDYQDVYENGQLSDVVCIYTAQMRADKTHEKHFP